MDFDMMVEMYNISKFYIPTHCHYDLAKDVVRYLTDMGHSDADIERYFGDYPEVMNALAEFYEHEEEMSEVEDMDATEYAEMERDEELDEKFGGYYYEYLDEE